MRQVRWTICERANKNLFILTTGGGGGGGGETKTIYIHDHFGGEKIQKLYFHDHFFFFGGGGVKI